MGATAVLSGGNKRTIIRATGTSLTAIVSDSKGMISIAPMGRGHVSFTARTKGDCALGSVPTSTAITTPAKLATLHTSSRGMGLS